MAKVNRVQSNFAVLACLLPFALGACGSLASTPAAAHDAAGNSADGSNVASTGTGTGTATGASLTNVALDGPAGITVLNSGTPDTGSGNIVDDNALSNTSPGKATLIDSPSTPAAINADVATPGQSANAAVSAPASAANGGLNSLTSGLTGVLSHSALSNLPPGSLPLGSLFQ